ncbi:S9 family peptidase [Erythrobacter sp. BLCC-B19]|uniref:S9 family peptidase n=1 Tax=Erythrobacter sp. BLCC-B19 TaxID=3025315 RepID=UPI00235FA6E4|nr:DPP IV N-terminal domain-containing protein [Erythrobacter sp. BLCC-B19]WDA41398.1 DPP IV N-terminal domain-containing protein [Erythrobacter sp. BLCC-B19]
MTTAVQTTWHSLSPLPLERIFAAPSLDGALVGQLAWSPDSSRIAYQRAAAETPGRFDLWLCEARAGATPHMVLRGDDARIGGGLSADEAARRERQRQFTGGIGALAWTACGGFLLVSTGSGTIRLDIGNGHFAQIAPPDVTDVQPAPAGTNIACIAEGELWLADAFGALVHRISPPAEPGISYGVAEFVAQEEFARDTGFWWRPDGEAIAYTRVDETCVMDCDRMEIGADGIRFVTQPFPKAGTPNARVDLFVAALDGEDPVRIDLGDDPDFYLVRVAWSRDGQTLFVQRQSRHQRRIDLIAANPVTGSATVIFREVGKPWVNPNLDFHPLQDGGFLWVSERTGINQLYRHAWQGTVLAQLTNLPFPVASRDRESGLVGVDEAGGHAYVMSGHRGVTERHLYRVSLDGNGPSEKITAAEGWWSVAMAPDTRHYAAVHSSPSRPPHAAIYDRNGAVVCPLEPNRLDEHHAYAPFAGGLPSPEFGQIPAEDGQALDYVLLKPAGFDPRKTYPAILQVYGGPGRQLVRKAWRAAEERAFLDAGYVLFQLDNRGACGRGLAFEAPISRRLGQPELADQLEGLAFLRSLPFVDGDRIGAMGWSYGGFMTLRLMTDPRSRIRAGIAGGSIAWWGDYDTHYTERFMGHPAEEAEAYAAASVIPRLARLSGRLMLVHGMSDDNVMVEHAIKLIDELQRLGKTFDLVLYPGQRHVIVGTEARTHKLRSYREFFDRELGIHD